MKSTLGCCYKKVSGKEADENSFNVIVVGIFRFNKKLIK